MNMKHFLIMIITSMVLVGCGGAEERKAAYLEKAKISLKEGDLDKARIELKNVLQIDPKDAEAYFTLGKTFDRKKEYKKAFGNFLKAHEIAPDNLEYHAKIGFYYLILSGDIEKAAEVRDIILGKDGDDINGLLLKAGILLRQNNMADAEKIAQDIFSKQPDHVENAVFLSLIYLRSKKHDNCINVLKTAIKHNPNNVDLLNKLANVYFSYEKFDQAEKEYKDILERNPEIFSNHLQLATFYMQIGKADKAEVVLRKAVEVDEKDLERKLILVDFIQETKGNQTAIEELNILIAKNPEMFQLRMLLGKLYVDENNLLDAEAIYKSITSDFSNDLSDVKSRIALAYLYMKKENLEEAMRTIDEAYKISSNDTEVNFIKAKLLFVKKDYEGSVVLLRSVIKDEPDNIEAYILLSTAHNINGQEGQAREIINRAYDTNRTNLSVLIKLADYHAEYNNIIKLEKVVDNWLLIDPDNYEALSYKCSILNKRKMFSEVNVCASKLIELYPDMPNGYLESVPYVLAEKGKQAVIGLLDQGYKEVSENSDILYALVSYQVSLKEFNAAISKVQSAIQDNGEVAELYLVLAKIQNESGSLNDAKESLVKAKDIRPDWDEPYLFLANIYMTEKKNQKAIKVLQQGIAEVRNDLNLSFGIAKIYEDLGNFEEAINIYDKAYDKYTGNVVLINNLAILLSEHRADENSLKRAKELADKLKNSEHALILDTVGWVYYKTGYFDEAVNVLKTVTEKEPGVAVYNYHLGMALYKIGDEDGAKIYLTRSLANNRNFPGKEDAENYLKKLQ